jgi:four helix bundle protein
VKLDARNENREDLDRDSTMMKQIDKKALEKRTKAFALQVITFVGILPKSKTTDVLGYQLLKSGTSIGANYREARSAESIDDFIHKIAIVTKEANESKYWLELFDEADIGDAQQRLLLLQEASELLAIFTSSGKTAKSNRTRCKTKRE